MADSVSLGDGKTSPAAAAQTDLQELAQTVQTGLHNELGAILFKALNKHNTNTYQPITVIFNQNARAFSRLIHLR